MKKLTRYLRFGMLCQITAILIFIALLFVGNKGIGWRIYYVSFLIFNIYFLIREIKLEIEYKREREEFINNRCDWCCHNIGGDCTRIGINNNEIGVCWLSEEY